MSSVQDQTRILVDSSLFGPSSDAIDIYRFIESSSTSDLKDLEKQVHALAEQSSLNYDVSDITSTVESMLTVPSMSAHIKSQHETQMAQFAESEQEKQGSKRKRKTRREPKGPLRDQGIAFADEVLNSIGLKCWQFHPSAKLFVRPPKIHDYNALYEKKCMGQASSSMLSSGEPMVIETETYITSTAQATSNTGNVSDAVLTFSVFSPNSWTNYVIPLSQHVLLSSQTLADLVDVLPCTSEEIPVKDDKTQARWGAVICVEGVAYGVTDDPPDYSEKLINVLAAKNRSEIRKGPPMKSIKLSSLLLRTQTPYWYLHQGSCTHLVVLEQVRLYNPSVDEETSAFPLTLGIIPHTLDICRACNRVPAVLAVSGDVRLGESPCVLCGPCWETMGQPKDDENVRVVPLPAHVQGWFTRNDLVQNP